MARRRTWLVGLAFALVCGASAVAQPPEAGPGPAPGPEPPASPSFEPGQRGYRTGLRIEAAPTRTTVQVSGPVIEQTLTLTNQGPDALVDLGPLASTRATLTTAWARTDGSAISAPVPLAKGETLVVTVSANAPLSGVYRSRVRLLDAADRHVLWAGYFAVERRPALSSAGTLQSPGAPFQQTIDVSLEPVEFTFALRNASEAPLAVQSPQVLQLRRETNGQTHSILSGPSNGRFDCAGAPAGQRGAVVLPSDGSCVGVVSARNGGAGAYVAQVAVTGIDGGQASGDVRVNVRLAWYWSALVTALGSIGGWVVGSFRREWRARSLLAEAAALQRERLTRITRRAQASGMSEVIAPTVEAVDALIQTIQHRQDLSGLAEQLATLGARVERLDRWQSLEARVVGTPDADTTRDVRRQLRAALQNLDTPDSELTALFAQVTQAVIGSPPDEATLTQMVAAAPTLGQPPSSLDAPMIASRTSDAAALIASRRKHIELAVNAVAGAVLVASAVQAVWANDPTWGDLSDVLGLLISAFAIQAGGSVALGQWTGGASSAGPPNPTGG